MKFRTITG